MESPPVKDRRPNQWATPPTWLSGLWNIRPSFYVLCVFLIQKPGLFTFFELLQAFSRTLIRTHLCNDLPFGTCAVHTTVLLVEYMSMHKFSSHFEPLSAAIHERISSARHNLTGKGNKNTKTDVHLFVHALGSYFKAVIYCGANW